MKGYREQIGKHSKAYTVKQTLRVHIHTSVQHLRARGCRFSVKLHSQHTNWYSQIQVDLKAEDLILQPQDPKPNTLDISSTRTPLPLT